jgi:flagellar assembly factor FliW
MTMQLAPTRTPASPAPADRHQVDADAVDVPVLELIQPLAGFPDARRFALARLDETGLVCDLRSLDDPELSFVVVPPTPFFADYSPVIDDAVVAELELEGEDDLLALVVVTLGDTPESATANLLAPVLVNHRTQRAGQYLLSDADLPVRAPLSQASAPAHA